MRQGVPHGRAEGYVGDLEVEEEGQPDGESLASPRR